MNDGARQAAAGAAWHDSSALWATSLNVSLEACQGHAENGEVDAAFQGLDAGILVLSWKLTVGGMWYRVWASGCLWTCSGRSAAAVRGGGASS